jgi:hypothetical protein
MCCIITSGFECNKNRFNPYYIKLNATLNNTAEYINLGDTLKFKLTIPDTLVSVSQKVPVTSLQQAWYSFTFYQIDTATKLASRMVGKTNFASDGGTLDPYSGVYVSKTKPYTVTLNLVPPAKGLYYLQITPQPGSIDVNDNYHAGLKVNFAVADKHWVNAAKYFNTPNNPDYLTSMAQLDGEGYGWYNFWVK